MAHVRDSDTSLWLHNKLGTSNDLWSGGSICSQLNQDVLRNIRVCFIELQPHVKLKLLLSFLHIPRRNVEEWKIELEEILEVALVDSDQWVSMLAELLKSYPSSGALNFQIEENASVFTDVVTDLKKLVKKHSDQGLLPLECLYLNRNALAAVVGQLPQPTKHFTLKQKPKSATLRAELLQKSIDVVSNLRRSTTMPSVPIRCRGLIKPIGEGTPLKGIPNRLTPNNFKDRTSPLGRLNSATPARPLGRTPGRKDGGIKLLEIDEQPMGYGRDAKRRKKAAEDIVEARKEKEGVLPATTQAETTPDYAAGLLSTSQLSGTSISVIASAGTPAYAPPTPGNALPTPVNTNLTIPAVSSTKAEPLYSDLPMHVQNPEVSPTTTVIHTATIGTVASLGGSSIQVQKPEATQPATTFQQPPKPVILQPPPQPVAFQQQTQTATFQLQQPPQSTVLQPQQQQPQLTMQTQPHVHSLSQAHPQPPSPPQPKKLSLTKEQMHEAQQMFNNSNKVTRPEKALILGFIAGSRANPCPHLGQIVTIMLSQDEENIQQRDGSVETMTVETHFQMNYTTGEWKRVKKYRRAES